LLRVVGLGKGSRSHTGVELGDANIVISGHLARPRVSMAYTPEDDLVAGLLDGGCEICDEVLADPDGVRDGEVLDIGLDDGEEADRRGEEGGGTHIGRFETGLRGDERLFWNAAADSEMKCLAARG